MILLSGSPRRGGNSDTAATLLREGLAAEGVASELRTVGDGVYRPCVACGHCERHPGQCVLNTPGDDTATLFEALHAASALVLVLPVYFYGPPAQCKALMDRAQTFWWQASAAVELPRKPFYMVQVAARTEGARLFEANGLIGRCFARHLGFAPCAGLLASPAVELHLTGLDGRGALAANPVLCETVQAYGRAVGQAMNGLSTPREQPHS